VTCPNEFFGPVIDNSTGGRSDADDRPSRPTRSRGRMSSRLPRHARPLLYAAQQPTMLTFPTRSTCGRSVRRYTQGNSAAAHRHTPSAAPCTRLAKRLTKPGGGFVPSPPVHHYNERSWEPLPRRMIPAHDPRRHQEHLEVGVAGKPEWPIVIEPVRPQNRPPLPSRRKEIQRRQLLEAGARQAQRRDASPPATLRSGSRSHESARARPFRRRGCGPMAADIRGGAWRPRRPPRAI